MGGDPVRASSVSRGDVKSTNRSAERSNASCLAKANWQRFIADRRGCGDGHSATASSGLLERARRAA